MKIKNKAFHLHYRGKRKTCKIWGLIYVLMTRYSYLGDDVYLKINTNGLFKGHIEKGFGGQPIIYHTEAAELYEISCFFSGKGEYGSTGFLVN